MALDLPLIWGFILAIGVMMYVLLDGFDLGVGMLTFLARSDEERNMMTATIEPVWDGNETWLIIGGGGLFAAFPAAYGIIMPAFYLPVLVMLAALIFRGVAFEFRHKAVRPTTRRFWNGAFFGGSATAAFSQGLMLGGMIQGIKVEGGAFAGGAFDWLTPFSLLVGLAVVIGYVMLGACWLVLKTEDDLFLRARKWARLSLAGVAVGFLAVSLATLAIDPSVGERWGFSMTHVDFAKLLPLSPAPLAGMFFCAWLWRDLSMKTGPGSAPDWRPSCPVMLALASAFIPILCPLNIRSGKRQPATMPSHSCWSVRSSCCPSS